MENPAGGIKRPDPQIRRPRRFSEISPPSPKFGFEIFRQNVRPSPKSSFRIFTRPDDFFRNRPDVGKIQFSDFRPARRVFRKSPRPQQISFSGISTGPGFSREWTSCLQNRLSEIPRRPRYFQKTSPRSDLRQNPVDRDPAGTQRSRHPPRNTCATRSTSIRHTTRNHLDRRRPPAARTGPAGRPHTRNLHEGLRHLQAMANRPGIRAVSTGHRCWPGTWAARGKFHDLPTGPHTKLTLRFNTGDRLIPDRVSSSARRIG